MNDTPVITVALLEKLKSSKGGYSRASLEVLGVGWPPKRGWRKELVRQARKNEAIAQAATPEVDVHGHAQVMKHRMLLMSLDERVKILSELCQTYCRHCGSITDGKTCHCTNDDEHEWRLAQE